MESPFQPAVRSAPDRRPIRVTVLVVIALLIGPAIVLANHQFPDVPTGASYHDDVEALVGAGITSGCGGGNYCPGNAVTRGQMAQFLNRGLGVATSTFDSVPILTFKGFVNTITIPAGDLPGGLGYVNVSADLTTFLPVPSLLSCPCGVQFLIVNVNVKDGSPIGAYVVPEEVVNGSRANTGTISWVFEVPSGQEATFGLLAILIQQPPELSIEGPGTQGAVEGTFSATMTAEYSPFGFDQILLAGPTISPEGIVEGPFGPMTLPEAAR